MTPHIKSIDLSNQDIPGLSKKFTWQNIGMFSVITGKNGSGKTKLVEKIRDVYFENFTLRYIDVHYQPHVSSDMHELSKRGLSLEGKHLLEGRKSDFNREAGEMDLLILKNVVMKRKELVEMAESKRLAGEQTLAVTLEPCDEINQMFKDAELPISLKKVALHDRLEFVKKTTDGEKTISLGFFSSGEKLIFALSLWRWGSMDGKRTQLLLIDEFDAHLNPCLMKNFIDVLKKNFVSEGVQVIMTTHSPTTVKHASDNGADVIWMEDGEIIEDKSHREIISELSSELITVDDFFGDLQCLIDATIKDILYTEGKTDPKYLESAAKILILKKENEQTFKAFKEIKFFGCVDDRRMIRFIELPIGRKKAALLDNCVSEEKKKSISDAIEEYNKNPNNTKVNTLNITIEFREIECLFGEEFLKNPHGFYPKIFQEKENHFDESTKKFKGLKSQFAKKIKRIVDDAIASKDVEKIKAAQEIFKNFEPLLTQILQAFSDGTKKS